MCNRYLYISKRFYFAFLLPSLWYTVHGTKLFLTQLVRRISGQDGAVRPSKCVAPRPREKLPMTNSKQNGMWNVESRCNVSSSVELSNINFASRKSEDYIRFTPFQQWQCNFESSAICIIGTWREEIQIGICKSLSKLKSTENKRKKSGKRN